jgi:hypothetical protein
MTLRATAAALGVVLAVAAAGCAGPSAAPATGTASSPATASVPAACAHTPTAMSQVCGPQDAPGRLTTTRAADGVRLSAAEVGAGGRGVVLIPELDPRGKCTESHSKHLIVLRARAGHGWDLVSPVVSGGARPALSRIVLAFLRRVTS